MWTSKKYRFEAKKYRFEAKKMMKYFAINQISCIFVYQIKLIKTKSYEIKECFNCSYCITKVYDLKDKIVKNIGI